MCEKQNTNAVLAEHESENTVNIHTHYSRKQLSSSLLDSRQTSLGVIERLQFLHMHTHTHTRKKDQNKAQNWNIVSMWHIGQPSLMHDDSIHIMLYIYCAHVCVCVCAVFFHRPQIVWATRAFQSEWNDTKTATCPILYNVLIMLYDQRNYSCACNRFRFLCHLNILVIDSFHLTYSLSILHSSIKWKTGQRNKTGS